MNLRERSETRIETEWRRRLTALQATPAPNLARGRERVLVAAQKHAAARMPGRSGLALACSVGLAAVLMMTVLSSVMSAAPVTTVAFTRTDTAEAHTAMPANELPVIVNESFHDRVQSTPAPNAVPEPPRSPSFTLTKTVSSN